MTNKGVIVILVLYQILIVVFAKEIHSKELNDVSTSKAGDDVMDVTDFSIYYDMKTNETIKKMMPRPWYRPGWPLRLPFSGGPCKCEDLQCTCCSGIRIPIFNFDRTMCSKLSYNLTESMLDVTVTMNGEKIYNNSYSARNPPPFCLPVPVPYLPPGLVDMCIRLFEISVVDQKLHVCLDVDTRIDKAPVLVLHFDCMDMGSGGVSLSKPEGGSTNPQVAAANETNSVSSTTAEPDQMSVDVYDPVDEKVTTPANPFNNSIKYI